MKREELKSALIDHLRRVTGLMLSPVQERALEKAIKNGEIGADILKEKNPFSLRFQKLLSIVTVEESYFFRYPKQFEFFKKIMKEELIPRARREGKRISILSLGCARGEELYSALMVVEELLKREPDVSVVGVGADINLQYLDVAQKGVYSARSLRLLTEEEKRRYFFREGYNYRLKKTFRAQIFCFPVNVADWKTYPLVYAPYDVVFFRNVLIYLAPEVQKRVLKNVLQFLLRKGGYLFLGHADFIEDETFLLRRTFQENVYVYAESAKRRRYSVKADSRVSVEKKFLSKEKVSLSPEDVREVLKKGSVRAVEDFVKKIQSSGRKSHLIDFLEAWVLVNRGEMDKARETLEQLAENGTLMPEVYYLLGFIHFEKGDLLLAMRELQKAVYLNDTFVPAHQLLVGIYEKLNRERDYRRTVKILEAFEKGQLKPDWGLLPEG